MSIIQTLLHCSYEELKSSHLMIFIENSIKNIGVKH